MIRIKTFLVLFFLIGTVLFSFAEVQSSFREGKFQLKENGELLFGNDSLTLADESWREIANPLKMPDGKTKALTDGREDSFSCAEIRASRTVRKTAPGEWDIQYRYRVFPNTGGCDVLLYLDIPAGILSEMPSGNPAEKRQMHGDAAFSLLSSTMKIMLPESGWVLVDERNGQWPRFRLRLKRPVHPQQGGEGQIGLRVRFVPRMHKAFRPVSPGKAANRTLRDNDERTGWLGQGAGNDLSCLPEGMLFSGPVPFQIGAGAVVLKSRNTPAMPLSSGRIPVEPVRADAVYLLHTTAWNHNGAIAEYKLYYSDGSSTAYPVVYGKDVLDWWMAKAPANANVGWKGRNSSTEIALARLRIPADSSKELAGLELRSLNTACPPVLVAVTVLKAGVLNPVEKRLLAKAEAYREKRLLDVSGWFQCPIAWRRTIRPGTALDVGFLNHKPAGKFGFLQRNGDHFEFEKAPGEPVRFWGTNVAIYGCFPEKRLAPEIAANFAAQGVNLVRLHFPANRNELLFNSRGEFNLEMLDRFEFFCAELYRQGVYVYMDLNDKIFYDVFLGKPWHWPQPPEFSALFDTEVAEAVKIYARRLFTRRNPYTGRSIADEPGVALFQIINERTMLAGGEIRRLAPRHKAKLELRWKRFLKEQKLPERPCPPDLNGNPIERKFAVEVYREHLEEMHGFLRSLGVRVPVCGSSKPFGAGDVIASSGMDFQSSHSYFDDPRGNFSPTEKNPASWWNRSPLAGNVWGPASMMTNLGQVALAGSPLVLGEWNFCYPNFSRAEGFPFLAALAAYQSVDALVYFGASASGFLGRWERFLENPCIYIHSQQTDPATWGQSQTAALLYRRGDVRPAQRKLEVVVPKEILVEKGINIMDKLPFLPGLGRYELKVGAFNRLGRLALSSSSGEALYFKVLEYLKDGRSNKKRIVSDTGEIRRYSDPVLLLVDTPRAQIVAGRLDLLGKTGDRPADLAVNSPMKRGTVSLISLDGAPLRVSGRILATAVANAANASIRADYAKGQIYDLGKAPVVAEPFTASVRLRRDRPLKVFLLNPETGERVRALPAEYTEGELHFQITPGEKSIYFELTE